MKALILAAGMGSRLAPITDDYPKTMVPVNGKPILMKQLENLLENGITDITVVAGYKAEVLIREVGKAHPGVRVLNSADYASTNNMYSAYFAREWVQGSDFLMMNADVFFDSSVITALLACEAENAIVTDVGCYIEESMKVVNADGRLAAISKQIPPEQAYGSSIDVYKFSRAAGDAFFAKCREYIVDRGELKLWSEVALNDILASVPFAACPLVGRWLEIDNHDDLAAAETLFAN